MSFIKEIKPDKKLPDSYKFTVTEEGAEFWDLPFSDEQVMAPLLKELEALGIEATLDPKAGQMIWNSFPGVTYCG